ncbi:hypothetical protein ACLMAL_31575 [Nocardia sp. CWNU-33]|uniref:hypothetical protein n=1 Tax=Nocardia sp. CWNU-33 TaxID=3392117 RepID=UPI00398F608D
MSTGRRTSANELTHGHGHGLRRCRYHGQAKAHVQLVLTAAWATRHPFEVSGTTAGGWSSRPG